MRHPRAVVLPLLGVVAVFGCLSAQSGYDPADPTRVACGCGDGAACFDAATALASRSGETAETGEELLYLTQCACFEGSMAGCNVLSHFAKDWVRACDGGDDVRNGCAIAGYVHEHATRVPPMNGRSFPRDKSAAAAAYRRACDAGAKVVCGRDGG